MILALLLLAAQDPITPANAAQVREAASLEGHKGAVFHAAFSPDGKLLASAGIDTSVRIWDLASGKQAARLDGHTKQAIAVGFSADGATLASAGYDKSLRLWSVAGGKQIEAQTQNPKDPLQRVDPETVCNAFSPDGSTLAYAGGGWAVLWDLKAKTRREIPVWSGAQSAVCAYLGFSADGRTLAAVAAKGDAFSEVRVWDWKTGKLAATLAPPAGAFYGYEGLAVNPDGSLVAAVDSNTSEIHLLDVKTRAVARKLKGHKHDDSGQILLLGLAFSPDGKVLASASYDKTVRLWDVAGGKELVSVPARDPAFVAFSRDGARLAACSTEGSIQVLAVKK